MRKFLRQWLGIDALVEENKKLNLLCFELHTRLTIVESVRRKPEEPEVKKYTSWKEFQTEMEQEASKNGF